MNVELNNEYEKSVEQSRVFILKDEQRKAKIKENEKRRKKEQDALDEAFINATSRTLETFSTPYRLGMKLIKGSLSAGMSIRHGVQRLSEKASNVFSSAEPLHYLSDDELLSYALDTDYWDKEVYYPMLVSFNRAKKIDEFNRQHLNYRWMEYVNYKLSAKVYDLETGKILKEDLLKSFSENITQLPGNKLRQQLDNHNRYTVTYNPDCPPFRQPFAVGDFPRTELHMEKLSSEELAKWKQYYACYGAKTSSDILKLDREYHNAVKDIVKWEKKVKQLMKEDPSLTFDEAINQVKHTYLEVKHIRRVESIREGSVGGSGKGYFKVIFDYPIVHLNNDDKQVVFKSIIILKDSNEVKYLPKEGEYITLYGNRFVDNLLLKPKLDPILHHHTRFASLRYELVNTNVEGRCSAFRPL